MRQRAPPPAQLPPQIAMDVFDQHMPGANQLHVRREDVEVGEADLLSTDGLGV